MKRIYFFLVFVFITLLAAAQPANEDCATAQILAIGTAVNGTTVGASGSSTDCYDTNHDVWYKFTATATTHIVTIKNTSPNFLDINILLTLRQFDKFPVC